MGYEDVLNNSEQESTPESSFLFKLSSPTRSALLAEGIDTVQKLSEHTQKEILALHGIGPASLPALKESLEKEGLEFKQ